MFNLFTLTFGADKVVLLGAVNSDPFSFVFIIDVTKCGDAIAGTRLSSLPKSIN